nr:MAG TPA: hypothetical protein [Caudoviricetes sp.]
MMREELFEAIKTAMADTEVKHIDLWNHNVEFLEQEDAWPLPALFVEFGEITWEPLTGIHLRGTGEVRLHLVTNWSDGGYDAAFALCSKVTTKAFGLRGRSFDHLRLLRTETNHNHEEILENIDTYSVRYLRYGG